jgi:hypothetical protein
LLVALALTAPVPAGAIIGGEPAPSEVAAQTALIVSTRGASCSSAVLTLDLLLTAAHCVGPKGEYAVVVFEDGKPQLLQTEQIVLHPRFNPDHFRTRKPTPDLALVKLSAPLPARYQPAKLARDVMKPAPGESFTLTGYGTTREGDDKSAGKLNALELPAIGNTIDATGVIMVRLSANGKVSGACTGDSGSAVYQGDAVAAIIGWTTGTNNRECGNVTGATLVAPQLEWIVKGAKELGSLIGR